MAKVSDPYNHEANQRQVRHPLSILRKYIRRYVILEGLAFLLLFGTVLFWLGLAFDFGLYRVQVDQLDLHWVTIPINYHGVDWVQELNDVDESSRSSRGVRLIFLAVFAIALIFLGIRHVVLRWFREFKDRTLALVLERRFHKQLGDRLITAIELADPRLSKKYGYSQAMVEKTIAEAVETLQRLPVAAVFNWGRLRRLWILTGLATLGVWFVVMVVSCLGSLFSDSPLTPVDYSWRFYDVASIWTERNVLLMNSYWPRRAYLEIGQFEPSRENPGEMRVARDDERPVLQVRALEYVVADRSAPQGWRALRWQDLPRFVDASLLEAVVVPVDFADWNMETDELEPNLVAALFDNDTQVRTSGALRAYLRQPQVERRIDERGARQTLDAWLDWREWTMDKIAAQREESNVRIALRAQPGDAYAQLSAIFKQLDELAQAPRMSRTLRRLIIPDTVHATFRGEDNVSARAIKGAKNRYAIALGELAPSPRYRFRIRAEDFFTAPKQIVMVAPPAVAAISIDKEEPAYIYHRLQGVDQSPLRGKKHLTHDFSLSITGDTNTIEVPLGTNLVIHVQTDRKLHHKKKVSAKTPPILDLGVASFPGTITSADDGYGFSLHLRDLTRKYDFLIEFFDEDKIRGVRRFKIYSINDTEPQLGNLSVLNVNLRRPKIKMAPTGKDPVKEAGKEPRDLRDQAEIMGALLITPDALLPFECLVKDDYGLVRAGYQYKLRRVDFELGGPGTRKTGTLDYSDASRQLHAGSVASILQYWPGNSLSLWMSPQYIQLMADIVQNDLHRLQGYREQYVPSEGFNALLERKESRMIPLARLDEALREPRSPQPWEYDFKDDRDDNGNVGFDVRRLLPQLKAVDPEKAAQFHYLLQISVQASDNNVETGPLYQDENGKRLRGNTKRNKNGYVTFLVVSENELLSQIALEEENLFEKLEIAKEKVDAGIISLLEQQSKLRDAQVDMDNVLNRMNEIRTALSSSGNHLREAHLAYKNILREMEVNRVRQDRLSKIREKILFPLEDIVQQGSYDKAEEAFLNAHQVVEKDVNAKREPDVNQHKLAMTEAGRHMEKLSYDIKLLLDAMSEGIVEGKLIALLVSIEERQRQNTALLLALERQRIEEELRRLLGTDDEKKDPKKK